MNQPKMQPPIGFGSILQNRYRLIKILGQGGFGRTYLAEDQGRFNELCALKEFIPATSTQNYVMEKSKELFQREAAILYQIQHPQIPKFRATFEQDQRLFLVQDYVEGKTYSTLLDERKAVGSTFSEAEILQLLRQLLPVLAHIHSRGIIHRDISPDNIILRSDGKPVLIDFGVVKELATRIQSANTSYPQPTTVGKLGYAPSEQIQTGRAYPSSDLYALAVTSVVLLTGREPQELFDDIQLTWNWQRQVSINPELAQVLSRMLSYKPSDRYQSVAEVAKALQLLNSQTNPQLPNLNRQPQTAESSQIKTVAVNRHPDLIQSNTSKANRPEPVIPAPVNRDIWNNPWAIAPIILVVALLAGIGGWALMTAILNRNQRPVPQTFPSPLISPTPTPTASSTPTPTPSSEPTTYTQSLKLVPSETATVESSLKANATVNYKFFGEQGQQLSANLAQAGVLLTVLGPNQEPLDQTANQVTRYQGILPFTGEYTIVLNPVQGVAQSNYQLNLLLENPAPTPTPTLTPIPAPTPTSSVVVPTVEEETISFAPGESATQVSGQTEPQQIKRYLINVQEGQQLSVVVTKGAVTLDIRNPDGQMVENASRLLNWQGEVSRSGNYQIDVVPIPDKDIDFALDVSVRNLE